MIPWNPPGSYSEKNVDVTKPLLQSNRQGIHILSPSLFNFCKEKVIDELESMVILTGGQLMLNQSLISTGCHIWRVVIHSCNLQHCFSLINWMKFHQTRIGTDDILGTPPPLSTMHKYRFFGQIFQCSNAPKTHILVLYRRLRSSIICVYCFNRVGGRLCTPR